MVSILNFCGINTPGLESWCCTQALLSVNKNLELYDLNDVAIFPRGIEHGIKYRYFSMYCIKVRNSTIVTTLLQNDPT